MFAIPVPLCYKEIIPYNESYPQIYIHMYLISRYICIILMVSGGVCSRQTLLNNNILITMSIPLMFIIFFAVLYLLWIIQDELKNKQDK